jgi:putative endonuclease
VHPKGWSVYILCCADGTLYTGATNDLEARVARHGAGKGAAYTRSRLPVQLVFQEPASDRSTALRREAALKRLTREQKLALVGQGRKARRVRRSPSQAGERR